MSMLQGLIEIVLYVEHMEDMVAFYRDKLGLEILYPMDPEGLPGARWVVFDTGACKLALRGGGKKRVGEDAPRLVFRVDNVATVREALVSRDVALKDVRTVAGSTVCDGTDPEGNRFSLEADG